MWRPLRGLLLDNWTEMPHAEKNLSHHVHDSSIEPCLKKSRPNDSSSRARRDTDLYKQHEAKSQKWSSSTGSEDGRHQSNRCGGGIDGKYDLESRTYHSGEGAANERDCNKTNQHPLVLPRREKVDDNSDVTFLGTSTSFIGPVYRPHREKPVCEVSSSPNAASSFRIATVEVGKLASQSKGQDGMDYELRQFYKELNELEAEADDQNKEANCTVVDVTQCLSSYPNKTPTPHPSNHHHGQVPTVQPFGPFPSTPTNFVPLAREEPRTPLPLNAFSCDGQAPYHPTNSSFVSHAIPPPRFEGHPPPTFIVPFCPPPPQFNYPMTFPRQSNPLPPPPSQNCNYNTRSEPPPWCGSPVPPESRFTFQGIPYNKPFSQGPGERTWQNLQQNDLCRPQNGQFAERILPHTGNVSHEQHPGRFRDERKMVLLRGVPGSGKSTLARTLLQQSPDGLVLSTDDYFCQENGYTYDVKLLGDAHSWNQNRARRALDDGRTPVIIDNTNSQGWEMKPYVQMAVDRGYDVQFLEPDTWWKQDPHELEKRNTHRVPREKISQMLERYEYNMTVPVVMNSVEPPRHRPNRPPPDARPRTHELKEKRHSKRYRKNKRKMARRKNGLSSQDDEEPENLAVEDARRDYNVGDCLMDADGIGKVQVKIIYSRKEGYLSDSQAAFLSWHLRLGTAALFGMVSRHVALMDRPITQVISETDILVSRKQCILPSSLLFLVVGGMLSKGTNHAKPFFSWLRASSKGLRVTEHNHCRGQDINAGLDLYCNLINYFAGQTLHLYGMKCFQIQHTYCPKNRLTIRVSENQDGQSKQKCSERERFKNPPDKSRHECLQILDNAMPHMETKQTTPRRLWKIYKLAPTFQHPRILSASQLRTWKNGASDLNTEIEATLPMQNPLEDKDLRKLITNDHKDDLTRRETSCSDKDASVRRPDIYEDDLYPVTSRCFDGHEYSAITRSYLGSLPGTQSRARLCLPEQFARQLVDLFGCPGVELDASEPKDFIVPLEYDLAQRIYQRWKTSLEVKYKLLPAT